ncbi:MAG: hypothetical protein K2G91_10185 [Prevotella sp.]|nr:hypothetical protein [Prevotella sp.]
MKANRILKRLVATVLSTIMAMTVSAQSNGDKLFMEGQALQQKQTIVSQNQAIKKFEAAKVVYTTADKKKMCDNQISICNDNIKRLGPGAKSKQTDRESTIPVKKVKLSLNKNYLVFDGDKNGTTGVLVTAPSTDWNFQFSEGIDGEENFVKVTKSKDTTGIDIEVDANPSTLDRHQSIVVTCGTATDTLHVFQKGKVVALSTNTNLVEFKPKGGNKSIELYTNSDTIISSNNGLSWHIVSKPDWVETTVEVNKEKSVVEKGFSVLKGLVSGTVTAATATGVKTSIVKIVAMKLAKSDPNYSTGRKGEIVFASQDKTYTITVLQQ